MSLVGQHELASRSWLSLLLPTDDQTDLLRACLWSGDAGRAAWARWQSGAGDVRRAIGGDRSGVKSLLPSLDEGLRRNGAATPAEAQAAIRTAALAEKLRWEKYRDGAERAFRALAAAGSPFLVLKGAALAVSVYPSPHVRHSHDVDLLLRQADLAHAAAALERAGFTRTRPRPGTAADSIALVGASQLPIELHGHQYRLPYYAPQLGGVWARAVEWRLGGSVLRTLSPADHLVYVCGQAACCASRDTPKWAADAFHLVARGPDLDWQVVLEAAREARLALPLSVLLAWLARELDVAVPWFVLDGLDAAAARADRAAREIALTGVRAGSRGRFRDLFRSTPSWRGRLDIARWMVAPTPAALRLGEPLGCPRVWPAYYVARPLSYLRRRLAGARGPTA